MKKEFRKQAERIVSKSGLRDPIPQDLDFSGIPPAMFIDHYEIDYIHSLGQDSPFFMGLRSKKLLGSWCKSCDYKWANPRVHCMYCGEECKWFELPRIGRVHAFTVCHYGSEAFLDQTPFVLVLVEFAEVNTLFLSRLTEVDILNPSIDWIDMDVEVRFGEKISKKKVPMVSDVYFVPMEV